MINLLKKVAVIAALALAPMSASALTVSSTSGDTTSWSEADGDTTISLTFAGDESGVYEIATYSPYNFEFVAYGNIEAVVTKFADYIEIAYTAVGNAGYVFALSPVPVPAAALLLLTALGGLGGLGVARSRRKAGNPKARTLAAA